MADEQGEISRLMRCIRMAAGCISPLSNNVDERLAWYRLLDAIEGREPRGRLEAELRPNPTRARQTRQNDDGSGP